jgi:hypothetical protein
MDDEFEGRRDLFGNPWLEPKDSRGRKAHAFDKEVAEKIIKSRGTGASTEAVAMFVGLDEKTLRKYYSRQLKIGAEVYRLMLVDRLDAQSASNNTSATKALLALTQRGEAQAAREAVDERGKVEPRSAPLGKKEERQQAAERIGGKYAPPAAPTLIN